MYLGQSIRAYSDVGSIDFGNAGWHHAINRFTVHLIRGHLPNLWLVGTGYMCESMGLRGVGRLGNSAEPLRFQRVLAKCSCPLRRDAYVMWEVTHTCARLRSHMHFSCSGTGAVAPRVPSTTTSGGLSDTLWKFIDGMSDRALSVIAQEFVHSLLGLCVASATLSIIARTWLAEVVGASCS